MFFHRRPEHALVHALMACLFSLCIGLNVLGCGAQTPGNAYGSAALNVPVELELRRLDGTFLDIGALRGQPLLLFLFATFDGGSQAALVPLRELAEAHPDFAIIGIAIQPNARLFLDGYIQELSPPFLATYEPRDWIPTGRSTLGAVPAIPTFVLLDHRGRVHSQRVGLMSGSALRSWVEPLIHD